MMVLDSLLGCVVFLLCYSLSVCKFVTDRSEIDCGCSLSWQIWWKSKIAVEE